MLISYCASSWMIGWGLNLTFYVVAGTIAAFQRLMDEKVEKQIEEFKESVQLELVPQEQIQPVLNPPQFAPAIETVQQPQLQPLLPAVSAATTAGDVAPITTPPSIVVQNPATDIESEDRTETQVRKKIWRRPGIVDIVLIWALVYLLIWFWQYVIRKF